MGTNYGKEMVALPSRSFVTMLITRGSLLVLIPNWLNGGSRTPMNALYLVKMTISQALLQYADLQLHLNIN